MSCTPQGFEIQTNESLRVRNRNRRLPTAPGNAIAAMAVAHSARTAGPGGGPGGGPVARSDSPRPQDPEPFLPVRTSPGGLQLGFLV